MKKEILSFITIILLLTVFSSVSSEKIKNNVTDEVDNNISKEVKYIEKLQWYSPNGELPGTFEEYLKEHPYTPAIFSIPDEYKSNSLSGSNSICVLINNALYPKIITSINQYVSDLESEGYTVLVETVNGGSPTEIKTWIQNKYESYCTGFVFIGDITAAWAEVSGSVFPCDLFYMDIDGTWKDKDNDGDFETHPIFNNDMGPEVYIGRIYAHTLNYDTEANMVNDYLDKVHRYRTGELFQPWRGLEYVEEDWYDMYVALENIFNNDVTRFNDGYFTTGTDYLNQMDNGYNFVQVCAHSYSGGHYFGKQPTESAVYAHIYVYSPISRSAKLLVGCDDGIKIWINGDNVYTNDRYGGWSKDQFKININLESGWNRLMFKISQGGGDFKFSARITDSFYKTIDDLEYQINNPDIYSPEADYIRSWLLNGFHQDTSDNFYNYLTTNYLGVSEKNINPSEGDNMAGKTWTLYESGSPYINLDEYSNSADYGVCYAYSKIIANEEKNCQLWFGYDDGARIWLNGEQIVFDNRYGGIQVDSKKIDITLQPGENRLVLKVSEWMGDHGFTARLCYSDGSPVEGISFIPELQPIKYIGTWLLNGPYLNHDIDTRLSEDYLGNEDSIQPSIGDTAPINSWERGLGNGCPFDIGSFYDKGDWVYSQDIQNRDPPVLFYNLFACGPGLFTDENYLAGSYIFHTTYGLISVASSKSGSMLVFEDFTEPIGQGKTIGESFQQWFDKQAPYEQWEKEWYYGMIVFGDPTLRVIKLDNYPPNKPLINGQTSGIPGKEYEYEIYITDPEGDNIDYCIDWDDGNNPEYTGTFSPSPLTIKINKSWDSKGTYSLRVKAKDINGAESNWGVLDITIPKNRMISVRSFLIDLLNNFCGFSIKNLLKCHFNML